MDFSSYFEKNKLIMAPMSGITSLPFRNLNRAFGCKFAFYEMLDVKSFYFSNRRTAEILRTDKKDRPLGLQILGSDIEFIKRALEKLNNFPVDSLDLNAACPHKKAVSKNKGAALLKDVKQLKSILKVMVSNSRKPVTVKIRTGFDNNKDALKIALTCEDAGVKALFVHGRTQKQCYGPGIDYDAIRNIKKVMKIPVIASGDILTPELAHKMLQETGSDGVLVARGCLGNPWLFKNITDYLEKENYDHPGEKEIRKTMLAHLDLSYKFYGAERGITSFRKFYIWYTKGFYKVKHLRDKISMTKTKKQMQTLINDFYRSAISRPKKRTANPREGINLF